MISPSIQRLSWKEAKQEVAITHKNLFNIIEEINPSDHYSLYKVRYPFGAKIVDKGKFCLPSADDNCHPLSDLTFSSELTKELNYTAVPLALLLNKSCEVFIENKQHIISLNLLSAKQLFGLFEVLTKQTQIGTEQTPWSITAGARSIFMLPKITDMNAHKRIMRLYKVQSGPPKSLDDHWEIFKKIAKHTNIATPWQCDILFFSRAWLSEHQDNVLWSKFNNYLYAQAWIESAYLRNKTILNCSWEILISSLRSNNLKLKPYFMQAIKQLKAISYGFTPGYQSAGKNEASAPISAIENAYINDYDLQEYLPIIMYPNHLSQQTQTQTCYYSFASEILHEGSFTSAEPPRVINKLREIKKLMEIIENYTITDPLLQKYQNNSISYHYFHIEEDKNTGIKSSKEVPIFDSNMIETFYTYRDRIFPAASPFIRGCISITVSNKLQMEVKTENCETEASNLAVVD